MKKLLLSTVFAFASCPLLAASPWQPVAVVPGSTTPPGYTGAGDVVASARNYYSCTFSYSAAYAAPGTNPACTFQRASDSTTCTVLLAANGFADYTVGTPCSGATVTAFCNATPCKATTIFDQSGNALNVAQGTGASQAPLVFSCVGILPCLRATGGQSYFKNSGVPSLSQPLTLLSASNRTGGLSTYQVVIGQGGGITNLSLIHRNAANTVAIGHIGLDEISAAGTDNAWLALIGVAIVGAGTSSINVNGVSTSGTLAVTNPDTSAIVILDLTGTNGFTGDWLESGSWPVGFSGGQITSMTSNMRSRGAY